MLGVRRLRSHPSLTTTTMKDVSQTSPPSPPAPPAANNTEPLRKEIDRVSHSNSPSSPGLPTEVENGAAVAQNSTEATTTAVPRHGPRERDSSWLELEACREHLRQTCPRQADECRYAHPDPRIYVKEGRVTCCYDFLKDRCFREKCRYFHPPLHIKERLVSAGKQFGAMMSNLYVVPGNRGPTNPRLNRASVPLMGPIIYSPDGRVMSAAPPGLVPNIPYGMGAERMDVCPYFAQGKCSNPACHMIHPEPHVRLNMDATVTVCRDFVRGGCCREKCRYFHPSAGILAQSEHSAVPAMVQGIMVAQPVLPVYPPMIYPMPGSVTSLPSAVSCGVPLYPSAVTVPVVLTPSPVPVVLTPSPVPVVLTPSPVPHTLVTYSTTPISTITSTVPGLSNWNENGKQYRGVLTPSPVPVVLTPSPVPVVLTPSPVPPTLVTYSTTPISTITSTVPGLSNRNEDGKQYRGL